MNKEELEKELLKQIPKGFNVPSFLDLKADIDNVRFEAMEARLKADSLEPNRGFFVEPSHPLMEIYAKFMATLRAQEAKLVCPECGEPDRGNRVNKTPWCIKCNVPLVPRGKKKRNLHRVRVITKEKNPTFVEGV